MGFAWVQDGVSMLPDSLMVLQSVSYLSGSSGGVMAERCCREIANAVLMGGV
jgi:hypothetical protein